MVGYRMKDNGEPDHFKFVHHNVTANGMNEGKMEYAKFGEVGLKNYVSLFHSFNCNGLINIMSMIPHEEEFGC